EPLRKVNVGEAIYVRRVVDDPGDVVERTRRRAGGSGKVAGGCAHRGERGPGALRDRGEDIVRASPRRRPLVTSEDPRYGLLVARDDTADVGGAEIDAEIEGQTFGSLPASSGDCSAFASAPNTCCCAALYPFFALSLPNARSASS